MDKDEQYILDELAYSAGRSTWFEISGHLAIKLQIMMNRKDAEIRRLREALKECSADFVTKSSDHKIAAQEILNEFERRALLARAALKEKE